MRPTIHRGRFRAHRRGALERPNLRETDFSVRYLVRARVARVPGGCTYHGKHRVSDDVTWGEAGFIRGFTADCGGRVLAILATCVAWRPAPGQTGRFWLASQRGPPQAGWFSTARSRAKILRSGAWELPILYWKKSRRAWLARRACAHRVCPG